MSAKTIQGEPLKLGLPEELPPEIDARLRIVSGPGKGKVFPIRENSVVLGRDEGCHVVVDDPSVSGRHAIVSYRGGEFRVSDLGSTNGSLLNGSPLTESVFQESDDLRLGKTVIRLEVDFREPIL
jgi:pSer/pThr/pTyr-binding forkhead associated (FHA) protein